MYFHCGSRCFAGDDEMKESVTTLPGSLGVNPYQWTTAHHNVPPEWLDQEGHPCMRNGKHGVMQIVDGKLICVINPKESLHAVRSLVDLVMKSRE